jgi:hypothetical protein
MRFLGHVPYLLRNKNMERLIPYLLKKMVFLAFKTLLPLRLKVKKTFLSTLNVTILQMVRNEFVRIDRHVDIEISYKILLLKVLKKFQFCIIYLALNRSYFEMILMKNIPRTLGVEFFRFYKQVIFILHILL